MVDSYEALAASLGVSQIQGFPVREFYERKKRRISEDLLRDFADVNVAIASKIKAVWDKMDADREAREK